MSKTVLEHFLGSRAANTARTYHGVLVSFERWAQKPLAEATPEDALGYLSYLREKGYADKTVNLHYLALKSMSAFLLDMRIVDWNVFSQVRRAISFRRMRQVRPTQLVPFGLVEKIVASRDPLTAAIMALFFGGGLRISEVHALNVEHVVHYIDGGLIVTLVAPKAGKEQQQLIPSWAAAYIRRWIGKRTKGPLFPSKHNKVERLSTSSIFRTFRKRVRDFGVASAPHSARATCATRLLDMGFQDRDVAGFLRHSKPFTVADYDKRYRAVHRQVGKKLKF